MNLSALRMVSFCLIILMCADGCMRRSSCSRSFDYCLASCSNTLESIAVKKPMITVFIHGTRIFPKFYLQELFYSPDGLCKVTDLEPANHMHAIIHELVQADCQRFSYGLFYAFGWNGKLDFQERKKEAKRLYEALSSLIVSYKLTYKTAPMIRLITHSHGGNVALNLVAAKDPYDKEFHIDELILLACPVQEETKQFVAHPLFGRVYSLSSSLDFLQIIDPQGMYAYSKKSPLFSERYFPSACNVSQACLKMYGRPLFHIEFLSKKFYRKLPAILDVMDGYTKSVSSRIPLIHVSGKKIRVR